MKKVMVVVFSAIFLLLSGCRSNIRDCADGYKYLVGVSLTNVMEPWLNNLEIGRASCRERV